MDVFFYGLFMDIDLLSKQGVKASNLRKAYLDDYALKIGARASLIPVKGERAYGLVGQLEESEVNKLYAEASVADYIPEDVRVTSEEHGSIEAICYNLPLEALSGTNTSYANALYELAQRLGFPDDYLEKIKRMGATGN